MFNGAYSNGDCIFTGGMGSQAANSITLTNGYSGTLHLQVSYPVSVGLGGITLNSGNITMDNGEDLNDNGDLNMTGGNLNANNPFLANLNLQGSWNVNGAGNDTVGANVNLEGGKVGVINKPGNTITFNKNAGITINNTATLNLVDGTLATTGTGAITNNGTLQKTAGTATFTTALPLVNKGTFQLQNGELDITGTDGKGSVDQSAGTTDLWASTTLDVANGYYLNGGNLWTEGAYGSTVQMNGSLNAQGGLINLTHNNQTDIGTLSIKGDLTIQGTAEYDAKIDSSNVSSADQLSVSGAVTLGGKSTLKTVSINLVKGKVVTGQTWWIIQSGTATYNGDFATKNLAFNDGTGKSYTTKISTGWYDIDS